MPDINPRFGGLLVAEAVRLAATAHASQVDKQGQPYILHVVRVGAAGKTLEEQIVGFLHDVLEDTTLSPDILHKQFPVEIMTALAAITREPGEGYKSYIKRLASNPVAKAVKLNDLNDNMARLGTLNATQSVLSLKERYIWALEYLETGYAI